MNVHDVVKEYYELYLKYYKDGKVYGTSSEDLLDLIAPHVIKLNPENILDFGCGRSNLINHFWNDGKRRLFKYDPAIREYRNLMVTKYDLVICTDVLEHIPTDYLPKFFFNLKELSDKFIISVSLVPARQKLSDGSNAHISLLKKKDWINRLESCGFTPMTFLKSSKEGFIIKTW